MDWQVIINLSGSVLIAFVGWWCRQIWDSVQKLKEDIKEIEVDLPSNYVKKIDINTRFDRIDNTLERLFDKIEGKADK